MFEQLELLFDRTMQLKH